ncbi:DUF4239 domain-containing protein [Nocardia sp. CDC159]|uniref:DUF4239 domain-containing protein n=1 Tax=Nocardia pulmonis TaxID=2951408 RepID=A0A9X2IVQ3_9NOCA|nr:MULTISPECIES: DUF4239 domain-containing protein [Nocardia]MCM6773468.1 DUF4239 domain-containing protein [Nocardia pulmonis]MCM6786355.1 DUF4239 domain-containing protein [Nocardia sp. CDC159]
MVQALLAVVAAAAVAMGVFVIGSRVWPKSWQQSGDEDSAGGMVLDLVNTFFVAVVAFVVVLCWQQYDNAQNHTIAESKALVATYWIAHDMPEPERQRVQDLLRNYTEQVIGQEWKVMDREGRLSRTAQSTLDAARDAVSGIQSDDSSVADLRSKALDSLQQVNDARQDRAMDVRRGIPGFLYIALWFSTAMVLLSPVLSGIRVSVKNVLMIGLLGLVVGAVLFQIHNLDRPFSRQTVVPRDAYENALSSYEQIT